LRLPQARARPPARTLARGQFQSLAARETNASTSSGPNAPGCDSRRGQIGSAASTRPNSRRTIPRGRQMKRLLFAAPALLAALSNGAHARDDRLPAECRTRRKKPEECRRPASPAAHVRQAAKQPLAPSSKSATIDDNYRCSKGFRSNSLTGSLTPRRRRPPCRPRHSLPCFMHPGAQRPWQVR
jgi:hypothetical protein